LFGLRYSVRMWYVKIDLFQHRVTTLFTPIQTIREAGLGAW
jgi:hypothetical protein